MPTDSWPGTNGGNAPSAPVYCSWSVPQSPHASTRRSAVVVAHLRQGQVARLELPGR